ncbi:hypothetical protein ACFPYI_11590 [Halomarina salina]|uniref:Uncharacterized protein n=1 Tax=Halomarina salina TaxID=1872699 RepID=A0ABD5RN59_9EURY|nr:hypothetical protein [Halomarina salina]
MNPVALPGRLVGGVLGWLNDRPLVLSGAVMAVAAMWVLAVRVRTVTEPGTTLQTVPLALVGEVLAGHPAYAAAVVVGVGAVVFLR